MKEKKDIGFVNVIAIKDGVVEESYLFTGDRMEIAILSHNKLIELCREKFSNFDEYTDEDIESILDDGFAEYGKGSICITWPHVHDLPPKKLAKTATIAKSIRSGTYLDLGDI